MCLKFWRCQGADTWFVDHCVLRGLLVELHRFSKKDSQYVQSWRQWDNNASDLGTGLLKHWEQNLSTNCNSLCNSHTCFLGSLDSLCPAPCNLVAAPPHGWTTVHNAGRQRSQVHDWRQTLPSFLHCLAPASKAPALQGIRSCLKEIQEGTEPPLQCPQGMKSVPPGLQHPVGTACP